MHARRAAKPNVARSPGHALVMALALGSLPVTGHAAEYGTFGDLSASVAGDQESRQQAGDNVRLLTDQADVSNQALASVANAYYYASLASASLAATASASAQAELFQAEGNANVNSVSFFDRLTFSIPAGTYASGLSATFHGIAAGSMEVEGCTNPPLSLNNCSSGFQVFNARAGGPIDSDSFDARVDVDAESNAADSLGSLFALRVSLLAADQTLLAPLDVAVAVSAYLQTGGSARNTYGYEFGAKQSLFNSNATLHFTRIESPEGVTWGSASGVFLSQPIPEPESWALLAAGLVVLAMRRRSRKT